MRLVKLLLVAPMVACSDKDLNLDSGWDDLTFTFEMHLERFDAATGAFDVLTPPPTERTGNAWVALGDRLYAPGGIDAAGVGVGALEVYDPSSDTWSALASGPSAISYGFALNDLICVVEAGSDSSGETPLSCYDPSTDTWSARAPVPAGVENPYPIIAGGHVWIFGGARVTSDPSDPDTVYTTLDQTWSYDSSADAWSEGATMPWGLGLYGAATVGASVYLVGGVSGDGVNSSSPTPESMLVYDTSAGTWSEAPQMPGSRLQYGVDALESQVAVFFGVRTEETALLDHYDPSAGSWTSAPDPEEEPNAGAYTYNTIGDRLFLLTLADEADTESVGSSGQMLTYDLSDDAWSLAGTRDRGVGDALFQGAVSGDDLYYLGAEVFYSTGAARVVPPASRRIVQRALSRDGPAWTSRAGCDGPGWSSRARSRGGSRSGPSPSRC